MKNHDIVSDNNQEKSKLEKHKASTSKSDRVIEPRVTRDEKAREKANESVQYNSRRKKQCRWK